MTVDPAKAAGAAEYQGEKYYFCGRSCLAKFSADPDRYLQRPEPAPPKPAAEKPQQVEYTCPMHPEVRQMGPGACPKCGMALEPVTASAGEEDNAELKDMTLGDLLEGIVLHAFENKTPFSPETLTTIEKFKELYGLTLTADQSHTFEEIES